MVYVMCFTKLLLMRRLKNKYFGLQSSIYENIGNPRKWQILAENRKSDLAGRGPDFQDLPKLVVEYVNLHIGP